MQLRHLKTLLPPSDKGLNPVTAICWSPNNMLFAAVTTDRVVHLFDADGERQDKFATKPAPKGLKNYTVNGLAFSPDSTKLAIAQSDNIVYVYNLGSAWGDKKSICNRFTQASPVTSIVWPSQEEGSIVFGLGEGKVRVGQTKNNKSATLYKANSYTLAVAANSDGNAIVSSHIDGSIYRFYFGDGARGPSYAK